MLTLRNGVVLVLEGSEFLELVGRPGAVRGRLLQLYEPDLAPATD